MRTEELGLKRPASPCCSNIDIQHSGRVGSEFLTNEAMSWRALEGMQEHRDLLGLLLLHLVSLQKSWGHLLAFLVVLFIVL